MIGKKEMPASQSPPVDLDNFDTIFCAKIDLWVDEADWICYSMFSGDNDSIINLNSIISQELKEF